LAWILIYLIQIVSSANAASGKGNNSDSYEQQVLLVAVNFDGRGANFSSPSPCKYNILRIQHSLWYIISKYWRERLLALGRRGP